MVRRSVVGLVVLFFFIACLVGCGSGSGASTAASQSVVGSNTSSVQGSSSGSPQPTFGYVPYFNGASVYGYAVGANTGALTVAATVNYNYYPIPNPVALAVHPSQRYLYVGNVGVSGGPGQPGNITAYSVASNGSLAPLPNGTVTIAGDVAPDFLQVLAMHPSGKFLYVATNQGIESLSIDPNTGLLGQPVLQVPNYQVNFPIAIDSTGRFLFTSFCLRHWLALIPRTRWRYSTSTRRMEA